jgi:hypothetical protein
VAPFELKPLFLFCNGLMLGLVFGCVFAYLEGRRATESLVAGLCASFIMASGTVKTVGATLMQEYHVSPYWMPFATGAIFWLPLMVGVWMLQQVPPPDAFDVAARSERSPFNGVERRSFFTRYSTGFCLLILVMVLMTVFRSVRDDYAPEIWTNLGVARPAIFALSEVLVAFVVTALSATVVLVRDNYRAFVTGMSVCGGGFLIALATASCYQGTDRWTEQSAFLFMVLLGIGFYIPYMLFHTAIYERVTAMLREKSNAGFLLYLGDSGGYLLTVVMMAVFDLALKDRLNFMQLLFWLAWIIAPLCIVACLLTIAYFHRIQPETPSILVAASQKTPGSAM